MAKSKPGAIHLRIVAVMKRFPGGISAGQIRQELEKEGLRAEDQTHLDRRKRELKKWFVIKTGVSLRLINGKRRWVQLYSYAGKRAKITDEGNINLRLRAEVIHAAHGACQMCGKTIAEDGIKLVVDHKRPRAWGGTNDRGNLWAICVPCNQGKKAFFSSLGVDNKLMKKAMAHSSVHMRIGEVLKQFGVGNRVPSYLLEVVADQEDWHKRLRELRYPVIGWEIGTFVYKTDSGRRRVDYVLRKYRPWPKDPTNKIRQFERRRQRRNEGETD